MYIYDEVKNKTWKLVTYGVSSWIYLVYDQFWDNYHRFNSSCIYTVFYLIFSEPFAKIAARKFARQLQKIGFDVRFSNFKVVNVLGTCSLPFKIKVADFARKYPREVRLVIVTFSYAYIILGEIILSCCRQKFKLYGQLNVHFFIVWNFI